MKILTLVLMLAIAGCASFDGQLTKFHPLRQESGKQVYLFTTSANFIYPLDSEKAEEIRINWLKDQLRKHGLNDKDYTILERKAVEADGGVIGGKAYHLYYEVLTNKI